MQLSLSHSRVSGQRFHLDLTDQNIVGRERHIYPRAGKQPLKFPSETAQRQFIYIEWEKKKKKKIC